MHGFFSLEEVIAFFTGASRIPPLGFGKTAMLKFSNTSNLPTANTCSVVLTLPSQHPDDATFFEKLNFGFKGGLAHFGQI